MYNVEKYVSICLDSIFRQTFQDFELIIVNDGSTDRSREIVESYKDPRLKLFNSPRNGGEAVARNLCFMLMSESKYVYMMDADDAILPETLETFFNAAEESQADAVYMNSKYIAQDPDFELGGDIMIEKIYAKNPEPRFMSDKITHRIQQEFLNHGILWEPWIKLVRREIFFDNEIYIPDFWGGQDIIVNLAILLNAKRIRVINATGYIFRQNPDSVTHSSQSKVIRKSMESLPNLLSYSKKILSRLKLENQVAIKSQLIFHLLTAQHVYFDLSLEEKDQILREFFSQPHEMNPDLFRAVFESFMMFTKTSKSEELD